MLKSLPHPSFSVALPRFFKPLITAKSSDVTSTLRIVRGQKTMNLSIELGSSTKRIADGQAEAPLPKKARVRFIEAAHEPPIVKLPIGVANARIVELEQKNAQLEERNIDLGIRERELASHLEFQKRRSVDQLEREKNQALAENAKMKDEVAALKEINAALQEKTTALRDDNENSRGEKQRLRKENSKLKRDKTALKKSRDKLKDNKLDLMDEVDDLKERNDFLLRQRVGWMRAVNEYVGEAPGWWRVRRTAASCGNTRSGGGILKSVP